MNLNLIHTNEQNLLQTKQIEIAHKPIDFFFTGKTNNIEFLPPYFDLLDSLSSKYSLKDSLNTYSLELLLTGTLANPIRNGTMNIKKGIIFLDPINEPIENINAKFNSDDLNITFNSRYLTDIASQIENESIVINLKDAGSPVLINDFSDKNSFHVVMPMKI